MEKLMSVVLRFIKFCCQLAVNKAGNKNEDSDNCHSMCEIHPCQNL